MSEKLSLNPLCMVAESGFDKRNKERRAAALLVLAQEKKGDFDRCLTDEEMAALVDGSCTVQERERGWTHLSECTRCYEQWYSLKMGKKGAPAKRGRVYLLRPKNLAIIGSALAVAASVAVFLNIPQAPSPGRLAEDSLSSPQVAKEAVISVSQDVETEVTADEVVSPRPAQSVMADKRGREHKEDRFGVRKEKTGTVIGLQAVEKMSVSANMAKVKMGTGSAEDAGSIKRWLELVKKGCLEREGEVNFWSDIVLKGDQFLRSRDYGVGTETEEVRTFRAILQLVPRENETELIAERCKQILVELAEGEQSM